MNMKMSFRWYGESDPISLEYISQIPGMRSIVSAVYDVKPGEVYKVPLSHGEGRFIVSDKLMEELVKNGQIATCYVDKNGNPTYDKYANPNGSNFAVEGITSKDGRILGKMGHAERIGDNLYKNIDGNFDMKLFEAGVSYFK